VEVFTDIHLTGI